MSDCFLASLALLVLFNDFGSRVMSLFHVPEHLVENVNLGKVDFGKATGVGVKYCPVRTHTSWSEN